jgi:hypothetical protein
MFEIGNYVNWYEDYNDGISGKDWGDGIIIDERTDKSYSYGDYCTYKVYRTKYKDFYWFEKRQLRIKEIK